MSAGHHDDMASAIATPAPSATPQRVAAPHRALALDAVAVLRLLRDHPRDAGPWGEPAFAREVEAIRRQLAPIHHRRALTASYRREAFRLRPADPAMARPITGPTTVAYAMRWLELGDGVRRPAWIDLVVGRA